VGLQFRERWAFTPTPQDAGDHPISIDVRDESNNLVAHARATIHVALAKEGSTKPATLLIVGDSLTEASSYPRQVLKLANKNGASRLRLIGTRGPGNMPPTGDVRHEGYSGWTAEAFDILTGPLARSGYYLPHATGSPFMYESEDGSKALNFARYCKEVNEGKCPDLVTIGLGTNDTFNANDQTIDGLIDRMFVHYDSVIQCIRKDFPDTQIGVQIETPSSASQDGFRNYVGAGKQTRWQCRRNEHRTIERMIEHFGNRTEERIYLVPNYLNLDTVNGFPTWTPTRNAESEEKITRVNNGTHPSESGYKQIGDTVYSWVVNALTSQGEN
jgi:lysophospholipase L1-like esterase